MIINKINVGYYQKHVCKLDGKETSFGRRANIFHEDTVPSGLTRDVQLKSDVKSYQDYVKKKKPSLEITSNTFSEAMKMEVPEINALIQKTEKLIDLKRQNQAKTLKENRNFKCTHLSLEILDLIAKEQGYIMALQRKTLQ